MTREWRQYKGDPEPAREPQADSDDKPTRMTAEELWGMISPNRDKTRDLAAVDAIAAGLALLAEIRDELRSCGRCKYYWTEHPSSEATRMKAEELWKMARDIGSKAKNAVDTKIANDCVRNALLAEIRDELRRVADEMPALRDAVDDIAKRGRR